MNNDNDNSPALKLTDNGIAYEDTESILEDVKSCFRQAFPNLEVDSASTPQGQIINFITEKITEASNAIIELTNANYNGGYGFLEDINAKTFFGIDRKPASKAVVKVEVRGKPATIIPKNFKAMSGDLAFINSSGEVPISENGSANIEMTCEKEGEYQILANTLTTILTPVYGIESINNESNSTKGTAVESNLWNRALNSQFFRSLSLFESYIANVNNVAGVTDCIGYDNYSTDTVTYKNNVFPPHSLGIVVEGGDPLEIAQAIFKVRNPGPALLGDIEIKINGEFNFQEYVIRFYRPTYVDLRCKFIVNLGHMANENYEINLKNQIIKIINQNKIAQEIFTDSKALQIKLPYMVDLVQLQLQKITDDNIASDIENEDIIILDFTQKARLKIENIEVVKYQTEAKKSFFKET